MARKDRSAAGKTVDPEIVAEAFAKAVYEGDIVNFRLLFMPFSPARTSSTEDFAMPKYEYLLPDDEMLAPARFKRCVALVQQPETMAHIRRELEANRPVQLPSELLIELGDNAVRHGKYSSAAQAYELLRVRARMEQEFFAQADAALDAHDIPKAVHGYLIATGLAYDYAAFPEPLPAVPDFQTRALMLHGDYPARIEDCIGLRVATPEGIGIALSYLLADAEAAARLEKRPLDVRLEFLKTLVYARDPDWDVFADRYREACAAAREFGERLEPRDRVSDLAEEIETQLGGDPRRITALLLGRTIQEGEWWQYLKELACEHPAAALFVARQSVGGDLEILVPRVAASAPLVQMLELAAGGSGQCSG